jgi:hypothetical protein
MASGAYPLAVGGPLNGSVDYDTDTFYVMLLADTYTPDFDAHDYRNDVEADEASGTGYTAGGASVSVSIGSFNTTTNKWTVTLGSKVFTAATITARYAAYYKRRGGASTADELIGLNDFGSNVTSTAGDFTVNASTFEIELNAA